MKKPLICLVLLAAVAMAVPLAAHHGRGASFDMKKQVTLKGTVSQVKWQNPHVLIFIDVPDAAGKAVTWGFENSNVHTLATQGYNRNTLKFGPLMLLRTWVPNAPLPGVAKAARLR